MEQRSLKGPELTAAKLRRILRWAKNKSFALKLEAVYNNSLGESCWREYYGIIRNFAVENHGTEYKVLIELDSGKQIEEWLGSWYEFMGKYCPERVILYYKNSGPYCWFSMRWLTEEEKEKYLKNGNRAVENVIQYK